MPAEITKLDVKKMVNRCDVEIEVGKTYRRIDTSSTKPGQSWCDIKKVETGEYKVVSLEKMVVRGGEFDGETTFIAETDSPTDKVHPNIDRLVPMSGPSTLQDLKGSKLVGDKRFIGRIEEKLWGELLKAIRKQNCQIKKKPMPNV